MYCKCYGVLRVKNAFYDIVDEVIEFIKAPSFDELSDIAFGINRLIGSIVKREYVRVLFGDGRHVKKIQLRMRERGCIRSVRHLKNNQCPSK